MNIVVSLDYEIWFQRNDSPPSHTLIEPTQALARMAGRLGIPLVLFVDVIWLWRLRQEASRYPMLMTVYDQVLRQLEGLAASGHELQLHLHPHWVDSHWDGEQWCMDLRRYRLHDFADDAIAEMVSSGATTLRHLAPASTVTAFRAGGWCLQPFERLSRALKDAGIRIDSTVYAGGLEEGAGRRYDFRSAPALSRWRFEHDPLLPCADGHFLEVPIASQAVSPGFYWHLALTRLLGRGAHRRFGQGAAMLSRRGDLWRKLSRPGHTAVSFDGLKASLLGPALAAQRRRGLQDFVILGHPKALTPHGLQGLERFITQHRGERFVGLNDYLTDDLSDDRGDSQGERSAATRLAS